MMDFTKVWGRVQQATNIRNLSQLAETIGKTPQAVSLKKRKGEKFPIEWAYLVAERYNLSTKWLLTGEGKKREGEDIDGYVLRINKWLENLKQEDPRSEQWFQYKFEKKFPEFKEWNEKEAEEKKGEFLGEKVREPVD
jgi:hypothetical protein